jgi:hypothetical protein
MDGRCIGEGHFIEFSHVVRHEAPIKVYVDLPFFQIDLSYAANVPVVDVLLVVVDRLDHFIPWRIRPAKAGHAGRRVRIESLLQERIQGPCSQTATVHRRQDLDVPDGMQPKTLGNPFGHHSEELGLNVFGTVSWADGPASSLNLLTSLTRTSTTIV